jgi:hypothetical protein
VAAHAVGDDVQLELVVAEVRVLVRAAMPADVGPAEGSKARLGLPRRGGADFVERQLRLRGLRAQNDPR